MSTPQEESTTTTQDVIVTPEGTNKQLYELPNPVTLPVETPLLSKDNATNNTQIETLISFWEKWRYCDSFTIDRSKTGGALVKQYQANLGLLTKYMSLGVPVIEAGTAESGFTINHRTVPGIRFDVEYKFTIYSSHVQQGALLFSIFPFFSVNNDRITMDANFRSMYPMLVATSDGLTTLKSTETSINTCLQVPHKIISYGAETEVIIKLPYNLKYDFIPIHCFPEEYSWSTLKVLTFDTLQAVETAYADCNVRVEIRFTNIDIIGASWENSVTSLGDYNPVTT